MPGGGLVASSRNRQVGNPGGGWPGTFLDFVGPGREAFIAVLDFLRQAIGLQR